MKKQSYAQGLFKDVNWLPEGLEAQKEAVVQKSPDELSKDEALDSMKKFTDDVLGHDEADKVVLKDVEIKREQVKADYIVGGDVGEAQPWESFPQRLADLNTRTKTKLFFVVSEFLESEESKDFGYTLEQEQAQLFIRMIKAMKLDLDQVWMSATSDEELFHQELLKLNPDYVVSLGAAATHYLMKKKVRLSLVQGEYFTYSVENKGKTKDFSFMPLFHPEYLLINPNMKRKTWNGMQKLMERL